MKTLIVHTDVTTDPKLVWRAKPDDPGRPRLLRLCLRLRSETAPPGDRVLIIAQDAPAPLEGYPVPGIDGGYVARHGVQLHDAMLVVAQLFPRIERVVAYAADFHRKVIEQAAADAGLPWPFSKELWWCAMRNATDLVRVPREAPGGGYAFPKMTVAYEHFSGQPLNLPADPIAAGHATLRAIEVIARGIQEHRSL